MDASYETTMPTEPFSGPMYLRRQSRNSPPHPPLSSSLSSSLQSRAPSFPLLLQSQSHLPMHSLLPNQKKVKYQKKKKISKKAYQNKNRKNKIIKYNNKKKNKKKRKRQSFKMMCPHRSHSRSIHKCCPSISTIKNRLRHRHSSSPCPNRA